MSESTSTPTLTKSLRAFGEMPAEGGDADPLIEVMNSLAHQAADRIEALEAALRRIVEATPFSTNSATPQHMASWTKAVAQTALNDGE